MQIEPYERRAQYYETDQMGVIHHANFIHWFEEARLEFFDQILAGRTDTDKDRIGFGVSSISCQYHSMVRFEDMLLVQVTISKATPTRLYTRCEVLDKATGKLRASGEVVMFYYHFINQTPVNLQKEIPSILEYFCSLVDNITFDKA